MGPGAQELDACLVTNLDAASREQRHAALQIGRFRALAIIQLRAGRAELIVKMMNLRVVLFADVTVLRLHHFAKVRIIHDLVLLKFPGRKHIGRGENFFTPQSANAGFVEPALIALELLLLALPHLGLHQAPAFLHVGTKDLSRPLDQA